MKNDVPDEAVPQVLCVCESDVPTGTILPPGVGAVRCSGCGVRVVAASSTRDAVRRREMRPVCRSCFKADPVMILGMTREQVAEVRSWQSRDAQKN